MANMFGPRMCLVGTATFATWRTPEPYEIDCVRIFWLLPLPLRISWSHDRLTHSQVGCHRACASEISVQCALLQWHQVALLLRVPCDASIVPYLPKHADPPPPQVLVQSYNLCSGCKL
eukprot:4131499-Amphidinium_carterae.1